MLSTPLTEQARQQEWDTVCTIATNNGFPLQIIHSLKNKIIRTEKTKKKKTLTQTQRKKWITFTSHSPFIHKVTNLFKRTDLNILTYLLTPWCRVLLEKLAGIAASQEIPRISWNPKVHYRIHKLPPPVPILGQPNPVPIPATHLLQIHPNIIHPSTPRSPQRSLSLRFPHQDPIRPPLLLHTNHMPSPSHSS